MTQDELWQSKYQETLDWMNANQRNPSKHRIEEHNMLSWIKHSRKLMNAGKLKTGRMEQFQKLLALSEEYKRKNQYS